MSDLFTIRQTAKLKSSPNFPAIRHQRYYNYSISDGILLPPDPFAVSISINRTDPPGFIPGDFSEYRAASGPQEFTCTATGGTGDGPTYQWSSTCDDCVFSSRTNAVIKRGALHSGDNGTHICTATRGGESAMDSIVISIVGEWQ